MPFLLPLTSVSIPRGLPSIPRLKLIVRSLVTLLAVFVSCEITVLFSEQDIDGRGRLIRLLHARLS